MSLMELASLGLVLVAAGGLAGLVAGLFGVGGGTVIVPALFYAFSLLGLGGASNLHVAVGSSLLVIIATSWTSLKTHQASGAVDQAVLRDWLPWIALGALTGSALAALADKQTLAVVYAVALFIVAAQMGLAPAGWTLAKDLPTGWPRRGIGGLIGTLSAMMGIGGGALGAMLMTLCNRPIHQAVATASGFGLAIGIPATLGFILGGWDAPGRPPGSLGYVNIPAAVLMGLLTTRVAPFGARLAHRMNKRTLRRAFAVFLALTALSVVIKTWF